MNMPIDACWSNHEEDKTVRYIMQQKFLSLGANFAIKDETGADVYLVHGQPLLGFELSIQDLQGNELAKIHRKLLTFSPTYEIYRNGQLQAVVTKSLFSLFGCRFTIDVPGPNDLEARGDLLDHEYTFVRGERLAATASKQWFSWTDTYGIDVMPDEDDVLILASSVVIEMASGGGEGHSLLGILGDMVNFT
jgi:uncharacterized protein YxjI